jgi:hypothetical protein
MSRRSEYRRKKAAAALARRQALREPKPAPVASRVVGGLSGIVMFLSVFVVFLVLMGALPPEAIQSTRKLAGVVVESEYEHRPYLPRRAGVNEFRLRLEGVDGRITLMGLSPTELETLPASLPVESTVELRVTPDLFGDYWLWQVKRDGLTLVKFADTLDNAQRRVRLGFLAFALLIVSGSVYWRFRPESPALRYRRRTRSCS